ncbi:MAG: ATP-binding protein [Halobacteriales archaeon]|nr:ATP-binding protein [Halobacteriales archaeon]
MARRVNVSGLIIAGIGFFLTRFTVTLAIYEDPIRFYFAGVIPLALGLGLAAFGVALTVADIDSSVVRTTALWCVIGAGTMLVLVMLTLVGSTAGGLPDLSTVRSRTYLSNFLIGGSVGGTLTGLYASRTRRQRGELRRQRNRLEVLNRILRHEVLNAVTVIRGFATTADQDRDAGQVIEEQSTTIEQAIEEVKYLTRQARLDDHSGVPVDVETSIADSVATVNDRHPAATVSIESVPSGLQVRADERLEELLVHLLENAIDHAPEESASVAVSAVETAATVRISVTDQGSGLSERQRRLLETGEIQEFDDPNSGFGLNVARLLVEGYGGTIETDVDADGTTITVVLPRWEAQTPEATPQWSNTAGVRPALPHLLVIFAAAVIAGLPYGFAAEYLGGSVAAIGVFYGFENPVIGWLTHEFHSVVFGFVFAGLVSLTPVEYQTRLWTYVGIGLGWALCLWLLAAGVIAPIWLRLLGIPAPIPNLSSTLLVSHLAWGLTLGVLTAWGYAVVTPWLRELGTRLRRRSGRIGPFLTE